MAGGVGNLMELQGKVNASGALVITIGSVPSASGGTVSGGVNVLPALQGKVTASNELLVRFV
jgi:hypothetical protein